MSTKFFILSKKSEKEFDNHQIFIPNNEVHILPYCGLGYYLKYGLYEKYLIEWSKSMCKKDKIMLDIGAHSGTYSISLASLCKEIYAFEPQKQTYYCLCGSVALSNIKNVTCLNVGLGSSDQVGIQDLNIISNDGGLSTLNPDAKNVLMTEKIEVRTLDSYNLTNIGFIKMDVEENELFVLKGAVETLKKSSYPKILFESNFENKELFDFIESLGYKIIKLTNYNNMFLADKIS